MVARDVQQGHVEAADEVFEVVPGQVAAAEDEVRLQGRQPFAVESLFDLVGDGEDARVELLDALEPQGGPGLVDGDE